jgi:hypothetical protein
MCAQLWIGELAFYGELHLLCRADLAEGFATRTCKIQTGWEAAYRNIFRDPYSLECNKYNNAHPDFRAHFTSKNYSTHRC